MTKTAGTVYVVDDDADLASSLTRLFRRNGYNSEPFSDPPLLLLAYAPSEAVCFVTDIMMGDTTGFAFARSVRKADPAAAIVFMTGWPRAADAVDAIRLYGGIDYLEKPLDEDRLLNSVGEALAWSTRERAIHDRLKVLSSRERQVFDLIVSGHTSKTAARELGVSPRTVDDHRRAVMAKLEAGGITGLMELARDRRNAR